MKMKALLDKVKLFVLDMDGTFYLGDRRIDGALDFIHKVKETGRDFIFFTNNSSKNGSMYIEKLAAMDCPITKDRIMTSGDVTAAYLKSKYPGKKVYLVGTPALEAVFREEGICLTEEKPEVVVIGFDMTLTYEKLERACTYIREGAVFLATHKDINCPTETGFIPDCGAICAAITLSTGVLPRYLGKPCRETLDMVLQRTGYNKDEIAFVGDRIYTDVATGVNNGALGILVLSGETKRADIAASEVQPDGVFESLKEMLEYL
ncbi:HAD-IIA family hydrolase [Frisingicoccus sp.]|uniref:HAD-IIA family hydrolase n=1 Tax=Frisingicoccus sp. TaxID=1918627 RepID=UPI003AB5BD33